MRYQECFIEVCVHVALWCFFILLLTLLLCDLMFWSKKLYKFSWYTRIRCWKIFNKKKYSSTFIKFFTGFFQHDLYAETLSKLLNNICNFVSFALYDKFMFKWLSKRWTQITTNYIESARYDFKPIRIIQLAIFYSFFVILLMTFISLHI